MHPDQRLAKAPEQHYNTIILLLGGFSLTHKLHVYTGNGKGKTTAAMGLALRAAGHGQRVLIAQYMKDGQSGELYALRTLDHVVVYPAAPIEGFISQMSPSDLADTKRRQSEYTAELIDLIADLKPRMIILDELGAAVSLQIIDSGTAMGLIRAAITYGETVVTGYQVPEEIRAAADYVSVISCERHPYLTEGLPAREGVEW